MLIEMTLKNLQRTATRSTPQDFLDRADILATLGHTVLISNYGEYHRLAAYLFRYTKKMIGLVMGVPTLREIFDDKYYSDLEGGILESFGRLFKNELKIYAYPQLEATDRRARHGRQPPRRRRTCGTSTSTCSRTGFSKASATSTSAAWRSSRATCWRGCEAATRPGRSMVPPEVADLIKTRRLLGYTKPWRAGVHARGLKRAALSAILSA